MSNMMFIESDLQNVTDFVEAYPADTPVVMLNLLRFGEQANYEPGTAEPCSGGEAYMRYGAAVAPLVEGVGGSFLWQGRQAAMLIGPSDKDWHLVVLVRYPSAQAFVDMVSSEAYQSVVFHRAAGLEDSRLIALREL